VFPVRIPALRERREDIPLLIEHFLGRLHQLRQENPWPERPSAAGVLAIRLARQHPRVENLMERGVIITDENQSIGLDALFPHEPPAIDSIGLGSDGRLVAASDQAAPGWVAQILDSGTGLDAVEDALMQEAMQRCGQNVSEAARLLGVTLPLPIG
jgi:DNA-binding NtrC family response regulator